MKQKMPSDNRDLTDITDILKELMKDEKKEDKKIRGQHELYLLRNSIIRY